MDWRDLWRRLLPRGRRHGDVKRFDHELQAAGGIAGRADRGVETVPTEKIVGSVSRWQNLRSDFFYRSGEVTARFVRVGEAMRAGKMLPPLELYKLKPRRQAGTEERAGGTEYYVVDGHHRVAMARKLGQDYLDAHVVEYRAAGPAATGAASPPPGPSAVSPPPAPASPCEAPAEPTEPTGPAGSPSSS
jgi:hypothetical protein